MELIAFSSPRPIKAGDEFKDFHCGETLIDTWVKKYALSAKEHGTAIVYVTTVVDKIAGFYTLSNYAVGQDETGGWISRNVPAQIPVTLLGMMGVDKQYQNMGIGAALLQDAIDRSMYAASIIGSKALVVDPINEKIKGFYAHFGFQQIKGSPKMFTSLIS